VIQITFARVMRLCGLVLDFFQEVKHNCEQRRADPPFPASIPVEAAACRRHSSRNETLF